MTLITKIACDLCSTERPAVARVRLSKAAFPAYLGESEYGNRAGTEIRDLCGMHLAQLWPESDESPPEGDGDGTPEPKARGHAGGRKPAVAPEGKVTSAEAASILGVTRDVVFALARKGQLTSEKQDDGSYVFSREQVEALAQGQEPAASSNGHAPSNLRLTAAQIGEMLDISPAGVHYHVKEGRMKPVEPSGGGKPAMYTLAAARKLAETIGRELDESVLAQAS